MWLVQIIELVLWLNTFALSRFSPRAPELWNNLTHRGFVSPTCICFHVYVYLLNLLPMRRQCTWFPEARPQLTVGCRTQTKTVVRRNRTHDFLVWVPRCGRLNDHRLLVETSKWCSMNECAIVHTDTKTLHSRAPRACCWILRESPVDSSRFILVKYSTVYSTLLITNISYKYRCSGSFTRVSKFCNVPLRVFR